MSEHFPPPGSESNPLPKPKPKPEQPDVPLPKFVTGELIPLKGWWLEVVGVTKYQEVVLKLKKPTGNRLKWR